MLQPFVEHVGEFCGHRVRRFVEHGEGDEKGLVVQGGRALLVGEPAGDLGGYGLLAIGGEFLLVHLAPMEGDELKCELLDIAGLLLPGQELCDRCQPAQPLPGGPPGVPGDV
ncbi:hypothetical protein [Streptomyces sp. MBT33]|uniref:hypothetical protein n=1 Tax=Streptomyces sp. MBT33 TaxID=1488363 RepID=UPI001F27713F|nr:hypothetical protein [Streptomyces sp. MBT33]